MSLVGENVTHRSAQEPVLQHHIANDTSSHVPQGSTASPALPSDAVAIIGVGCKLPGANSVEEFWDILANGTSMCHDLPKDRFPDWRLEPRSGGMRYKGNMMDDVAAFDHKFFKISSREAAFMDPQQRLALQVTYQALESAGWFTHQAPDAGEDVGCYMASVENDYHSNTSTHPASAFSCTGIVRSFIAGKVSHFFGFTGPSIVVDAACAASGIAIHQACRAIASGECTTAVAGGTNVLICPSGFQNLAAGQFISSTGQSKSFDAAADGYCRGEGVAVVVLKRLSAALHDGDPIKAVIAATAINHCSNEVSIVIPHGPSQTKLYQKALQMSQLTAHDVTYIEAHGTGTPVGDPIEAESIRRVFARASPGETTFLGSVKSNIGHTETISGVAALVKILLVLQKGIIPQQALFNTLNPQIAPLEPDGLAIPTTNVSWTAPYKATCLNNYGASGTNAVMIVTQPPQMEGVVVRVSIPSVPVHITAFSASSLASYCTALLQFIDASHRTGDDFAQEIAFHLSRRTNPTLPYSLSGSVTNLQQLKDLLNESPIKLSKPRPVIIFFGGQTGEATSISRALYDSSAIFRRHLDSCEEVLQKLGGPSIFPAIFQPGSSYDAVLVHVILFSVQYATAKTWIDSGIRPDRLIGHSFGQFTAVCVAGALSLRDGLLLIIERARLIKNQWGNDPGAMIAIEATAEEITTLLQQHAHVGLEVACYNGAQSFVLAGGTAAMNTLEDSLKSAEGSRWWKRLENTHAFHSALAEPSLKPLQDVVERLSLGECTIPVETCSKGSAWHTITPTLLASQHREPVYFFEAVTRIAQQIGHCTWLEAGSGHAPVLRRALGESASLHDVKSLPLNSGAAVARLSGLTVDLWNLGLDVDFWPFHRSQQSQYGNLNLPPYQFDKTRHWMEYEPSEARVTVQPASTEQSKLLQLLHKSDDAWEFRINTQCPDWQYVCSGHRILEVSVCALSSLLDLVAKAMDMIESSAPQGVSFNIKHVVTQRLIPGTLKSELKLKISRSGPRAWSFAVTSMDLSSAYTSGVVSAAGEVGADFARFQRLIDFRQITNLTQNPDADSVKGRTVYKTVKGLFQLPEAKVGIKEASTIGNEAGGYLSITGTWMDAVEGFVCLPLVCLNGLSDRQDDEIYINTAIGESRFKELPRSSREKPSSWALYVKFFERGAAETTCDIFVFDDHSKQLAAIILDVSFTKVHFESVHNTLVASETSPPVEIRSFENADARPQTPDPQPAASSETTRLDVGKALFDLLVRVADIDVETIAPDTDMMELGIDSLLGMEVAEEINTFFAIKIDVQEFANATDFGSLCRMVAGKATGYTYDSDGSSSTPCDTPESSKSAGSAESDRAIEIQPRLASHQATLDGVLRAFDTVRDEFDVYAKETGCDGFYAHVYPQQAALVVAYITEAFAKLGWDLAAIHAGEPIAVPHAPKYAKQMTQLMRALGEDGLVNWTGSQWVRTSKPVSRSPTSIERFNQIEANFPQFSTEHRLLHSVGPILDRTLAGKENAVALLFGSAEKRQLMADQYTLAPMQSSASRQLCSLIKKCFGSYSKDQTIRVLEIGGGTCGTTTWVVSMFAELGIPVEYTFSDISGSFVTAAKSKLAKYNFVKYRTLDIIKDPPHELIGYFDTILATNVIHATPSVTKSASNARKMLAPSGFLTLVEYTRSLYWGDIVFGQFDGWWVFDDGREHAIMDEHGWETTLHHAGFEKVDWSGGKTEESKIARIILAF